jgi:hypothetical protein
MRVSDHEYWLRREAPDPPVRSRRRSCWRRWQYRNVPPRSRASRSDDASGLAENLTE